MEKSEILKLLLSYGSQVDAIALEELVKNQRILDKILQKKHDLPPVITTSFLDEIIKTSETELRTTNSQMVEIVNYRYDFLKNVLSDKHELTNLISINKISQKLKRFSVIGIVLKKNDDLIVEDSTGHASFEIESGLSRYLVEDEVVALICEQYSGINRVKNIIYPDIPLKKEFKKSINQENYLFISDLHMDDENFNNSYYKNMLNWVNTQENLKIFISGTVSKLNRNVQKIREDLKLPVEIISETINKNQVKRQIGNVDIMFIPDTLISKYATLWKEERSTVINNLLKKRNLNPILTPQSYNNNFLLETVPDIIVLSGSTIPASSNYKGVTIITTGSFRTKPIYWGINMQTRETFKTDFS